MQLVNSERLKLIGTTSSKEYKKDIRSTVPKKCFVTIYYKNNSGEVSGIGLQEQWLARTKFNCLSQKSHSRSKVRYLVKNNKKLSCWRLQHKKISGFSRQSIFNQLRLKFQWQQKHFFHFIQSSNTKATIFRERKKLLMFPSTCPKSFFKGLFRLLLQNQS